MTTVEAPQAPEQKLEQIPVKQADTFNIQKADFLEQTFASYKEDKDTALYPRITDIFSTIKQNVPEDQIKSYLKSSDIPVLVQMIQFEPDNKQVIFDIVSAIDEQNKNKSIVVAYENTKQTFTETDIKSQQITFEKEQVT
jgi:hypothetical protein